MVADRCIQDSFDDDLDTSRGVADPSAAGRGPQGLADAKFESFPYLNHVLGLDLSIEIGKSPSVSSLGRRAA